jgi:hypothetical protein
MSEQNDLCYVGEQGGPEWQSPLRQVPQFGGGKANGKAGVFGFRSHARYGLGFALRAGFQIDRTSTMALESG